MTTALELLNKVAEVSSAVGWQSNTGAVETAGQIISCLYANPDQIERFITEGTGLFFDGTFAFENGSLTWHATDGRVVSPSEYRAAKGLQQ